MNRFILPRSKHNYTCYMSVLEFQSNGHEDEDEHEDLKATGTKGQTRKPGRSSPIVTTLHDERHSIRLIQLTDLFIMASAVST